MRNPYGTGIYLAESSQKADQYSDEETNRVENCLAMFVVRTRMGKVAHCHKNNKQAGVDTIIGGKGKRFREFVVTDVKNVYPEFLVIYDRVQGSNTNM